jgi:hypothetical protein
MALTNFTKAEERVLVELGFIFNDANYELYVSSITSHDANGTDCYVVENKYDIENLIKNIYQDAYIAGQANVRNPIIQALGL